MLEIPGYEILERIGKGGMGEVYVARQLSLGRLVAIKFLMLEEEPDLENDLARFRREAELMAKVSHPNILSIFDFGEVDRRPYLVMEYEEGGDLRRRMHTGHPMSPNQVLAIVIPVGEALAYLHRHGIIHRDLKPENILLHDGDNPRVSDFGIAVLRAGSGALTRTDRALGTLGYIAPEQQYRLKVDERADQFSLAALAYEMLTGQLPLGIFKPPSHGNPRLGLEVDAVILRALQEDPKARFATIRDFNAALGRGLVATSARPKRPASRPLAWSGLCLLAIVAGATLRLARPIAGMRPTPPSQANSPVSRKAPAPLPGRLSSSGVAPLPKKEDASPRRSSVPGENPPSLDEALKRLRARKIWEERGSPTGLEGQATEQEIWFQAARSIEEELKPIAYQIWQSRGSPTGPEGEAVKGEIWSEAQRRLYEQLTGDHAIVPRSRSGQEPKKIP